MFILSFSSDNGNLLAAQVSKLGLGKSFVIRGNDNVLLK
jgi:hypothetical protein